MTIQKLNIKLLSFSKDPLKSMWLAARNCYHKEEFYKLVNSYNKDNAIKLLNILYNKGHLSIFEHNSFQFIIENCSRSLLAQLTRHRIGWSYAVKSQHYQDHSDFKYKDLEKYIDEKHKKEYYKLMEEINKFYKQSIKNGIPIYIAREVLPNSTFVNIVATTNLRALIHFWKLRDGHENTPEIREVSKKLKKCIQKKIPELNKILEFKTNLK